MPNYVALFCGTPTDGPPAGMTPETMRAGMEAWHAWMQKHAASVVEMGGPLGRTKKISKAGIVDIRNEVGGYTIVSADSHEAAAKMFEDHPHFAIFPGERVEVMEIKAIPTPPA